MAYFCYSGRSYGNPHSIYELYIGKLALTPALVHVEFDIYSVLEVLMYLAGWICSLRSICKIVKIMGDLK
ncbi:hypothetical protein [Acinetobacter bereziniae]|uniref:hypothetical protein n=1 Tax=Acinetobacter bereziniae TaxID=106648 RepID=UPI0012504EF1|nr:hypothetical protein [Acinetobacter bereziniae]